MPIQLITAGGVKCSKLQRKDLAICMIAAMEEMTKIDAKLLIELIVDAIYNIRNSILQYTLPCQKPESIQPVSKCSRMFPEGNHHGCCLLLNN